MNMLINQQEEKYADYPEYFCIVYKVTLATLVFLLLGFILKAVLT